MSDNALQTTDEANDEQPVVKGTGGGEVKKIDTVDEDHPLVEETGDSALKTETESGAGEFLSDFIYEHDSAWVREWLQNHETACVRAAKYLIKASDEYNDGWLTHSMWVEEETGETVIDYDEPQAILAEYDGEAKTLREIEVNRPIGEVLEAARNLGYDPTIVWDVYLDERKIVTEDNGIGMTPYEFDQAFNTIFSSGAALDSETGGMFGVGSESVALVHGKNGGAEIVTSSRRTTSDGNGYEGFKAYSYLGGANALPGDVPESFRGTKFNIPVQKDFNLHKLQEWVEEYSEKLRVPLLYREHDAGNTPVEEEYEATVFTEDYGEPPVVIERPGEFSVVAGPDVYNDSFRSDDNDTFLVSMPIDRNTRASIYTFWDVVIQIHDEQGLIVAGPHRGEYREDVGDIQDNDVVLPEPTGDRDRLQRDSESKDFFYYVQDEVKSRELEKVSDVAERMKEADHPGDVIRDNKNDWTLFKKMVKYHGHHRIFESRAKLKSFVNDRDEFPDFDKQKIHEIYSLFEKVSHCYKGAGRSSKKSNRSEKMLGEILAKKNPDTVYMAASTGGNFTQRFKVIENTYDSPEVIVIGSAAKYDKYQKQYGFRILKNVPLTDGDEDDHDYDVPDDIHDRNVKTSTDNTGKAEEVKERVLKIRNDGTNSSIDFRPTIEDAQERLENGGTFGNHKEKLIVFPRSADENISDHYDLADYVAIVSVSSKEYDELSGYDNVFTFEEYKEWSRSALIATEDGAMTPEELVEDDRMVVMAYRDKHGNRDVLKLLSDDYEELRNRYLDDIRDQYGYYYDDDYDVGRGKLPPESERPDTLFAVTDSVVLNRAEWAFDHMAFTPKSMVCLKLNRRRYGYNNPAEWKTLNKTTKKYRLMVDTPKWDNSSDIYEIFPSDHSSRKAQMYLGFHDRGVDPTDFEPEELRDLI
jgi:hypothetical protein